MDDQGSSGFQSVPLPYQKAKKDTAPMEALPAIPWRDFPTSPRAYPKILRDTLSPQLHRGPQRSQGHSASPHCNPSFNLKHPTLLYHWKIFGGWPLLNWIVLIYKLRSSRTLIMPKIFRIAFDISASLIFLTLWGITRDIENTKRVVKTSHKG